MMRTCLFLATLVASIGVADAQTSPTYMIRQRMSPLGGASAGSSQPASPRYPMSFVTGISFGDGRAGVSLGSVPNDGVNRLSQIQALCDKAPSGSTSYAAYPAYDGQPIDVLVYTHATSGGGSANGDFRRAWAACTS